MEPTSEEKTERLKDWKAAGAEAPDAPKGKETASARARSSKPVDSALPFVVLADRKGLSGPLRAGIKAAQGWSDDSTVAPAEFERKLAAWLNAPAERS